MNPSFRIKSILLLVSLTLLLLGCEGSNANPFDKKDRWLRYKAHYSIIPQQPNWKRATFEQISYFGRYRHSDDPFHNYGGDPYGPIVAVWQVARYLGVEPVLKECGKKPTLADDLVWNTPEYKQAKKQRNKSREIYQDCQKDNEKTKKQATTYNHYYARSPNNYEAIAPKRVKAHASYEINASFGPMGGIPENFLSEIQKTKKSQLQPWYCYNLIVIGGTKDCYKLPGEESSLYYNIRSLLTEAEQDQVASSAYKISEDITHQQQQWEEIKGIKITPTQYAYLQKRCISHVFDCYLDKDAPDLTAEQQAYVKATTWELDDDWDIRDAMGKDANDYRIEAK